MPASGPLLSNRFTAAQVSALRAGLAAVLWASFTRQINSGDNPETCGCAFCGFHRELLNLSEGLDCECGQDTYRIQTNLVQIMLCQVAARNASNPSRIVRKRFTNLPLAGRHKSLANKLENLRRRAKRRYQQLYGADAYEQLRITWRDYLDSLRRDLSGRQPWFLRRRGKRSLPPFHKLVINRLVESVTPRLERLQNRLPPAAEVRRLTRLFLRYIRRGRMKLSIMDCAHNPNAIAPQLAAFIRKRVINGEHHA